MIASAYKEEIHAMKAFLNERTFICNLQYKLVNDKNITEYLKKLPERMSNFDELERMQKWYFQKETFAIAPIFNLFSELMVQYAIKNEFDAEQIAEPCRKFSDNTGASILSLIGYNQLIRMANEMFKFDEMFKKEDCDESFIDHIKERQEMQLNHNSMMFSHFIDNENYIDFEAKKKKYDLEKQYFENERKPALLELISLLLNQFEASDLSQREFFVLCGIKAFDIEIKKRQERNNSLRDCFAPIIEALAKSCDKLKDKDKDKDKDKE